MPRRPFIDIDELYERFWEFKYKADKMLMSRKGSLIRFGMMSTIVFTYPIASLCVNGPMLRSLFPWKFNISTELPDHLKKAIEKQAFVWLEKEGTGERHTFFAFSCLQDANTSLDSIRMGTLSLSTGAQIALPFYARFQTIEEAAVYAKKYLQPFYVLGKIANVDWDSEAGRMLLSTFVLSEEALAFLITRDLYSVQHPYNMTQESFTWFCHIFVYMLVFNFLHAFVFKGDSIVFALAFPIIMLIAVYTSVEWNKLAIFFTEHRGDSMAASISTKHTLGGKEFYLKFLHRNKMLREMVPGGDKLFTAVGDVRQAIARYVVRYDGVRGVVSENDEMTLSILGDDLPD